MLELNADGCVACKHNKYGNKWKKRLMLIAVVEVYTNLHLHADAGHVPCDCFCVGADDGEGDRS